MENLKDFSKHLEGVNKEQLYIKFNEIKSDYLNDKSEKNLNKLKLVKKFIEEYNLNNDDEIKKNIERNIKNNYTPYPQYDNPNFINELSNKQEYYYNKNDFDVNSLQCNNDFEYGNHQIFLKNFIQNKTPYKGILLYHGVGTGKTCSAVTIAENFRDIYGRSGKKGDINKRIIVLVPNSNVESGWRRNIFDVTKNSKQCTGDTYLNLLSEINITKNDPKTINMKINKMINKYYEFYGYREFANKVDKLVNARIPKLNDSLYTPEEKKRQYDNLRKKYINEIFSNRVLIVDEVHNLRSENNSDNKDSLKKLEEIVNYTNNLRLILLSATPMYNNVSEILWFINILLSNDKRTTIHPNDIFDKDNNITNDGIKMLTNKSRGYISYLRGENPASFPIRLFPDDNNDSLCYNPETPNKCSLSYPNLDIFKKNVDSKIKFSKLYLNEYTGYQLDINKRMVSKLEGYGSIQLNDQTTLKAASNIVFPEDNFDSTFSVKLVNRHNKYSYKTDIDFLEINKLKEYSIKFHNIIVNIVKTKGIIFIFSERLDRGCIPIALALERLGFSKYNNNNMFTGKSDSKLYIGDKDDKNYGKIVKNKNKYPANYIILSGDKNISPNNIQEINTLRSDENKNGEIIKVVIGSPTVAEGLDFKRIREIHIIDPWFNLSKIEQIIGRGIRFCSHTDLPKNEQNVTVYLHAGYFRDIESIDLYVYKDAEKKAEQMGTVEKILKENSIDCIINKNINHIKEDDVSELILTTSQNNQVKKKPYDTKYTKICSFLDNCDIKCKSETNIDKNNLDTSTINYSLLKDLIMKIIKFIKELFYTTDNIAFRVDDIHDRIKQYFKEKYDEKIINKSIKYMIDKKITLVNKQNLEGYLLFKNNYLYFQKLNKNKNISLYERKTSKKTFKKKINIKSYTNKSSKKIQTFESTSNDDIIKIIHDFDNYKKPMNDLNIMFFISKKLKVNEDIILDDILYDNTLLKWQVSNLNREQKNIILKSLIENYDTYYGKSKSFNFHIYNLFRKNFIYSKNGVLHILNDNIDEKPVGFFYKIDDHNNIMEEFDLDVFTKNFIFRNANDNYSEFKKDKIIQLFEYIEKNPTVIKKITKKDIYGYTIYKSQDYLSKVNDNPSLHFNKKGELTKRSPGFVINEGNTSWKKSYDIIYKLYKDFDPEDIFIFMKFIDFIFTKPSDLRNKYLENINCKNDVKLFECIYKTNKDILKSQFPENINKKGNLSKHMCEFIINMLLIQKDSYLSNDLYLFNLNLSHFL